MNHPRSIGIAAILLVAFGAVGGCTPTVKVATDQPITINLNVNIRHEILVKVDKQLDSAIDGNSDIF
ncbi:MAG TPA: YnbE family lipoprotein [Pseudomonadales bacterium]|nr:YnbE family lipoprotein [Pseudomonadales bacterium]